MGCTLGPQEPSAVNIHTVELIYTHNHTYTQVQSADTCTHKGNADTCIDILTIDMLADLLSQKL